MKVLRVTDRISVKENGVEFIVSPLTHGQKMEISDCLKVKAGQETVDYQKTAMLTLKFTIKEVHGLTNYDETPYQLEFKDDYLTDNCVSELMGALAQTQLFPAVNLALANQFETGLEGVEIGVVAKK